MTTVENTVAKLELENTLARLEAIEAIKTLKAYYARLCDNGYPPAELGALFTEDGIWEADRGVGRHVGRAAIEKFFAPMSAAYTWARHYVLNPEIEVLGTAAERARARWCLFMPCTELVDGTEVGRWLVGSYEDEYVKTDDGWRIASTRLTFEAHVNYLEGWASRFAPGV